MERTINNKSKHDQKNKIVLPETEANRGGQKRSRRWFLKFGLVAAADQLLLEGTARKATWNALTSDTAKEFYSDVTDEVLAKMHQPEFVGVSVGENTNAVCAISPVFTEEVDVWQHSICKWAREQGLDPDTVAVVMQIESCGDPHAVSGAGAQGLFQVMPYHFEPGEDMLDPDTNALRGVGYLRDRLQQTNGNIGRAFAGYNGGHRAAASSWDQWPDETKRYYVWSTGIYNEIQQGVDVSPTLQQWLQSGGQSLCDQASVRLGLENR